MSPWPPEPADKNGKQPCQATIAKQLRKDVQNINGRLTELGKILEVPTHKGPVSKIDQTIPVIIAIYEYLKTEGSLK